MAPFPHFCGGSYQKPSPVSANEILMNWLVEQNETPGATFPSDLVPTPGFFATMPFGFGVDIPGRGAWSGDGRCFFVVSDTLWELHAPFNGSWLSSSRGTVAVDANPATLATNGDGGGQLGITSGGHFYILDLTTHVFTDVLASDALQVGHADGYFIVFGDHQIRISDLYDGLTMDPTQFAQRSLGTDLWQSMLVDPYGYVTLLGSETGESWTNVGTFPFPFAPDRSGSLEEGIAAIFSLEQAGKSKVWLSTNKNGGYQVMRAQGFTLERISDHALEEKIKVYAAASSTGVSDAIGETHEETGHAFFQLTFPSAGADATHVYDFTTQQWHQRGHWIAEANKFIAWRPTFHCFNFSRHLMLDRVSGTVYEMSDVYGTDIDERPIRRVRQTPSLVDEDHPVFFDNLRIVLQTGVGVSTGTAEDMDPHAMLRISNDFGQTWGSERTAPAGKIGQFSRQHIFHNLGSGRGRVYHYSVTAAVPWRISGAYQKVRRSTKAAA